MKTIKNIYYTEHNDDLRALDVYLPEHADRVPAFIYFHGGGLEAGRRLDQNIVDQAKYLTDRGIAMISADYRLYPHAKYPEFIEDAAAAVAYVFKNATELGISDKIFVGGSSAGGYLSMMLCFDARYLDVHGLSPMCITGFVHDAGQPTTHFNVLRERELDGKRLIVDEAAPLYHIGMAPTYPPMLIIVSDNDMENRLEQTMLLRSTLRHFGIGEDKVELQIAHGKHTEYCGAYDASGNNVFATMITPFLQKHFN